MKIYEEYVLGLRALRVQLRPRGLGYRALGVGWREFGGSAGRTQAQAESFVWGMSVLGSSVAKPGINKW